MANLIVSALATVAAIAIVPGITVVGDSYLGPLLFALSLSIVNTLVRPVAKLLALPFTILTLGLFMLVINACMFMLAGSLSVGIFGSGVQVDSLGSAMLGSIVVSIASSLIGGALGMDDEDD
jgi:putative membrane protein